MEEVFEEQTEEEWKALHDLMKYAVDYVYELDDAMLNPDRIAQANRSFKKAVLNYGKTMLCGRCDAKAQEERDGE